MEEGLIKKAELIHGGAIRLPEGLELPVRLSCSTAGPGAGSSSIVLAYGKYRVKKPVTYGEGDFDLVPVGGDKYALYRDGELFQDGVQIQPVIRHCPNQAFFNLDQHCMYHCAYCTSPVLDPSLDKRLTTEKILAMIDESMQVRKFKTVAFTSGVVGSTAQTVDRMCDVVKAVRELYPKIVIGVEPYVSEAGQIAQLREAGANEIKINIECATKEILDRGVPRPRLRQHVLDAQGGEHVLQEREDGVEHPLRPRGDRPGHRHGHGEAVQDERAARAQDGPHERRQ